MQHHIFTIALLLYITQAKAQLPDSIKLLGHIELQNATKYSYHLILKEKSGKWEGYSLLDPGGPLETKTSIIANMISNKRSIAFTERKLIYSKSSEKNFCYISGLIKLQGKKKEVNGFFVGRDEQKNACGSGTLQFLATEQLIQLLQTKIDTSAKASIITSHNSEQIITNQDQIQLEVWDGGLEDNDSISIRLNNQLIEPGLSISREKKQFNIKLQKGENIISITALNEGTEAPNSARFSIITQEKRHPIVSFLRKGESAQIKIKVKP